LSLTLKKNTISNILLYTYRRNTYSKGRVLVKMYRVVPQMKRGNIHVIVMSQVGIIPKVIQ